MAAEKTAALVLLVQPYRESSYIVYLFTERHGLVHGIAKGIRSAKRGGFFLERGVMIEVLVYVKPGRELHTLGGFQRIEAFPSIRSDLLKTAVRDAAFEMILKTITLSDPHPELFSLFSALLRQIEQRASSGSLVFALWQFFIRFASMLGFGIAWDRCGACRRPLNPGMGGKLDAGKGGILCAQCSRSADDSRVFSPAVLSYLRSDHKDALAAEPAALSAAQRHEVTMSLCSYCMYHFDIRTEFKALAFLEEIMA